MSISEMNATLPEFMTEIVRVIRENPVYGVAVVLFANDGRCHSYAFNLDNKDYQVAADLLADYQSVQMEVN